MIKIVSHTISDWIAFAFLNANEKIWIILHDILQKNTQVFHPFSLIFLPFPQLYQLKAFLLIFIVDKLFCISNSIFFIVKCIFIDLSHPWTRSISENVSVALSRFFSIASNVLGSNRIPAISLLSLGKQVEVSYLPFISPFLVLPVKRDEVVYFRPEYKNCKMQPLLKMRISMINPHLLSIFNQSYLTPFKILILEFFNIILFAFVFSAFSHSNLQRTILPNWCMFYTKWNFKMASLWTAKLTKVGLSFPSITFL